MYVHSNRNCVKHGKAITIQSNMQVMSDSGTSHARYCIVPVDILYGSKGFYIVIPRTITDESVRSGRRTAPLHYHLIY